MAHNPKDESPDEYFERLSAAFTTLSALSRPARVATAPPPETPGVSLMAEAFSALLALEEGTPEARPVRLVSEDVEPMISDALVEDLTRRVAQRMSPDVVRAVVKDIVSQVAERLVKEEIARIRKGGNG
jgi:hypothetical protein